MTLPKNVEDAVNYIDSSGFKGAPMYEQSWQTIRAELHRLTDRMEAADALLREIMEFGEDRELHIRIQDHLTTSANG